jgi:hypothetical protein
MSPAEEGRGGGNGAVSVDSESQVLLPDDLMQKMLGGPPWC